MAQILNLMGITASVTAQLKATRICFFLFSSFICLGIEHKEVYCQKAITPDAVGRNACCVPEDL